VFKINHKINSWYDGLKEPYRLLIFFIPFVILRFATYFLIPVPMNELVFVMILICILMARLIYQHTNLGTK
jgi:hypothetical protein